MKRTAVTTFVVLALCSVVFWTPARTSAQVIPPNRNAVNFSVATFPGAPVYSVGADFVLTTPLDLTLAYSTQSISGVTENVYDVGLRYHFNLPTPGVDFYVGAGLGGASANAAVPGFGTITTSASGISVGGGVSITFTPIVTGYAGGRVLSLNGGSISTIDLGLLFTLAPRVGVQLGYLDISGTGAPYIGININFPSLH